MKDGKIITAIGSSRSGKTVFVKHASQKFKRVLIWDVEEQYEGTRIRTKPELIAMIKKAGFMDGVFCYTGRLSDFNFFSECAFLWAKIGFNAKKETCVIAEEISDVTTPGKAPEGWGILLRRGLKYGCTIFPITQRPAESDKTSIGNASIVHCCRLSLPSDYKYMANILNQPESVIGAMVSDTDKGVYEYIQRNMQTGETHAGKLTFKNKSPIFTKNP